MVRIYERVHENMQGSPMTHGTISMTATQSCTNKPKF